MAGDFLTDESGDLIIRDGDLIIGEGDLAAAQRILEAYPGEFREAPALGCNVRSMLNGSGDPFWRGMAKRQLAAEGIDADVVLTENGIELRVKN